MLSGAGYLPQFQARFGKHSSTPKAGLRQVEASRLEGADRSNHLREHIVLDGFSSGRHRVLRVALRFVLGPVPMTAPEEVPDDAICGHGPWSSEHTEHHTLPRFLGRRCRLPAK